jgi:large subunit ribosomal protein L24
MPTKAEIKESAKKKKLKIRRGDQVVIISGKDRGQMGVVAAVDPKTMRAIVFQPNPDNEEQPIPLNVAVKHRKARFQGERSGRFRMAAPIHLSNLMVVDPETLEAGRIGRRREEVEGRSKIVRYFKKSGRTIIDVSPVEKDED